MSKRLGKLIVAAAAAVAALGPVAGAASAAGQTAIGGTTITTTTTTTLPSTTTPAVTTGGPPVIAVPKDNPFTGRGMWIWEMPSTDGDDIAAIIAETKKYGIRTLMIKSGDGTDVWSQFNKALVTDLHEAGLKVCAWQFVYGIHPAIEANVGADAVRDGADCLVIDAESSYQGRYPAADTYIRRLRKLVGESFPVALAGFPYVDYHLSFPYSVFLGPDGAQYNLPQMYWADIGTTVSAVFEHTYEYNEIYRRPIFPLGQLWGKLSATAIEEFNALADDYGATGVSWWDWQSASLSFFTDMTRTTPAPYGFKPARTAATISRNSVGDLVIWAQEHLDGAGARLAVDGDFGAETEAAVEAFQASHHLPVTGKIDGATWNVLVKATPVNVTWTVKKKRLVAVLPKAAKAAGHTRPQTLVEPVPAWVNRLPTRDELHGEPGAGRPSKARR